MKILVFDRVMRVVGHRLPYASLVADALGKEHEVVLAIPTELRGNTDADAYLTSNFQTDYFPTRQKKKALGTALETRKNLRDLLQKHEPDAVAIPTADGFAPTCGLLAMLGDQSFKETSLHICVMRGLQVLPERPLKQWLCRMSWRALKKGPWQNILLIDPREWSRLKENEKKQIGLCPDPVPAPLPISRTAARELLGLPTEGKFIVSPGEQSHRKGTDLLIRGFAATQFEDSTYLVLMGKLTDANRQLLSKYMEDEHFRKKVIFQDRFLTETEFQHAILASNVVATPYRSVDRPSGIVLRCMTWERMIVFNDRGWLNWINQKYQVGVGADAQNAKAYGEALRRGLQESEKFQTSTTAQAFANFNSEDNFRAIWKHIITSGHVSSPPEFLVS
ncbi:MAG: hypothetical protein P8M80_11760 [Pirellulaceae bacterium]|nr:hypothetical protein [Pirellulaceae bacterium]